MLPKGPLGRRIYKKLKVYAGAEHPHAAQQPKLPLDSSGAADDDRKSLYATGRRKQAVARVWLLPGTGKIAINSRDARRLLRPRDVAHGVPAAARAHRDHRAASTCSSTSAAAASRARPTPFATASPRALMQDQPGVPRRAEEGRLPDARRSRRKSARSTASAAPAPASSSASAKFRAQRLAPPPADDPGLAGGLPAPQKMTARSRSGRSCIRARPAPRPSDRRAADRRRLHRSSWRTAAFASSIRRSTPTRLW